jgi:hypothetical protein
LDGANSEATGVTAPAVAAVGVGVAGSPVLVVVVLSALTDNALGGLVRPTGADDVEDAGVAAPAAPADGVPVGFAVAIRSVEKTITNQPTCSVFFCTVIQNQHNERKKLDYQELIAGQMKKVNTSICIAPRRMNRKR